MNLPIKSLNFLLIFCCFSVTAQNNSKVIITAVKDVKMDANTSYIYCSSMEIMWNELRLLLNETPKPCDENELIQKLNHAVPSNYQSPLEEQFVVAQAGLVKDSIVEKIDNELTEKFQTQSDLSPMISPEAVVAFAYLKRNVEFKRNLDDEFNAELFNNIMKVDYFGIDEGDPSRKRKDVFIHDFKNVDDFIIEIKCKDSLDEIYFAKVEPSRTLLKTYELMMRRINSNHLERFSGSDILKIPYMKFDTTASFSELTGVMLCNDKLNHKSFQEVQQRISLDLNDQGIKLISSAMQILDFADFERPPPRVLAFNKPFLMVMKRKGLEEPYFLYWVNGTEFMRDYVLKYRNIDENELIVVGKWQYSKLILFNGEEQDKIQENDFIEFFENGTFKMQNELIGEWSFNPIELTIQIKFLNSIYRNHKVTWKLDEINTERFVNGGKTKSVYEKTK